MKQSLAHSDRPVTTVARTDFVVLRQDLTVRQALDAIRQRDLGEQIVYFYIVDEQDHLVGVVPTRRLLTAALDQRISDIMVRDIITIPHTAVVLDACEFFAMYRFLAFPVVDDQQHIVGVVDVKTFTDEVFDIAEREKTNEIFELIGFRASQVRDASSVRVFRYRLPWLLATIGSGLICAMLAGAFEATLAQSIVLTFFITLILGLGESVSSQSMAVTIQALRAARPTLRWYLRTLRREMKTALLLGVTCGGAVALIAGLWRGEAAPALVIGGSILLSLGSACITGLSVPTVLHALRLDPKIAAGPVTLALADIFTLLFYFTLATLWL
ncbi:MAG: magnesium transporter [Sedimentisphaerales bacterium]|nr:magnesium transporter [Sedimentisphaerales bacterium]